MRGNAARVPPGEAGYPKTLAFAIESGTSSTVPSIAITRSPSKNAPGVWFVACGRATRLNSWLITWLPNLARASLIEALFGTFQYFPRFVHSLLNPLTRFFNTQDIESFDHMLMAITKHTTRLAGSFRLRSSLTCVLPIVCSITSIGMTVSIALNT